MFIPDHISAVLELLRANGYEAYIVGGAVRDMLRGAPVHDYDITTSATPDEMKRVFSAYRTVETGLSHGTLTVLSGGEGLEVTTYRIDGDYTDMRHPDEVIFTRSLKEDAARRDFTVNAMAYHPEVGVMDFFGGKEDLARATIRAVGNPERRFTEDALRILRAMRFASVLDFEIEEETARAMERCKEGLLHISAERIREEFIKLLCGKAASRVLRTYKDILSLIIPELLPLCGFDQRNEHHAFDVWEHTLHALNSAPSERCLRLAVFFHDFGKPHCFSLDKDGQGHFYNHAEISVQLADKIMTRLRFDNKTKEYILLLIRYHDMLPEPKTRQFKRLRSRFGDDFLTDWLKLVRADRTGQAPCLSAEKDKILCEAEDAAVALLTEEERFDRKSLAVNGEDLRALGICAGPEMGRLLNLAFEAVLDGTLPNEKQALLDYIQKNATPCPIECERKFLIRMPDLALLRARKDVGESEIVQTYLSAPKGVTARVRARTENGVTVYTHTEKVRISALSAAENEREITEEEYRKLIEKKDPARNTVRKTRFTLPHECHVAEIDIYPFWERQAILEVELKNENEDFTLPPFLEVIREVSSESAYKNACLARTIPAEEL